MSTDTKPSIVITDDMCERAWEAYSDARDNGEDEPVAVMRAALEAAFSTVPVTNYGIGLALQFFDMVICVKDLENRPAAGVYRKHPTEPDTFDSLGHSIDVNYGYAEDRAMGSRWIKRIAIGGLEAPALEGKGQ